MGTNRSRGVGTRGSRFGGNPSPDPKRRPLRSCVICGNPCPRNAAGQHRWTCSRSCLIEAKRRNKLDMWTPEMIVAAMQEWAEAHGRPPRRRDWERTRGDELRPSVRPVKSHFGSWGAALRAAGFSSPKGWNVTSLHKESQRSKRIRRGETCRNGLHPWVKKNILVTSSGARLCLACRRASQRRYRERVRSQSRWDD